ncbi:hypothetical protein FJW08_32150 [Mesorhizobium sp. B3-2-1]|uniref:hypothetical protein n=1 Tax=Mesorhizobium sp. B3-2-1 TaxID=2589891 RepID=UPI00112A6A5B|nr:hypothetical protein [Mesorhizobium sp. B3-2-1]TPI19330.1 hypothetical protein FJW08_32150 [Mesorhizobium sp. B3-2-1]
MKQKPADRQPLPEVFRLEREPEKQEALARYRAAATERCLAATAGRQDRPAKPRVSLDQTDRLFSLAIGAQRSFFATGRNKILPFE